MANQARYQELCAKKKDIENTVQELRSVLDSQKGVGMTEKLIDEEGFPRSDIDVYSCRHARHQISCLQNDHKEVMDEIEQLLAEIHAEARRAKEAALERGEEVMDTQPSSSRAEELQPFAIVDRVDQGSPASKGGIEVDDLLVKFGSITLDNFSLPQVSAVLKHSIDKSLPVTLLRGGRRVNVTLTPSRWAGPGFLGCNINPLPKES